ncbi:3-oxoacyl-[acyl-carrier-protein] synthase II, chloroplastic-like isoform X2 [Nymphaea colorata]|uniref:3-oxoacyl-[acyl-carrier-protein] synthase II, chloroplastic-like isoform X2 n=1 Tax=Nymphaea colorata TaxID=210225 RepID=UPI00129D7E5D|nr:3-oxoacyl-[acyl-carrier-protein] synthase II, chloroplastic-like isoform X2 [Nymphaea colorata]
MAIASSVCTWLVAACMSRTALCVTEEKKRPIEQGLGRLARRKKLASLMNVCSSGSSLGQLGAGTFSCSSFLNQAFKGSQNYYQYSWAGPLSGQCGLPLLSVAEGRDVFGHGEKRSKRFAAARTRQSTDKVATEKNKEAQQRRVVVTGMGVVTSLGHDPDTFYKNLLEGVSGISEIESFDCSGFPTRIAGEIKSFSPDGLVSPKISKRMDKFMLYMLTAGKQALIDGGLTEETMKNLDVAKCGVLIGSGIGGVQVLYDNTVACMVSHKKMSPFCVPFAVPNMGSATLAMDLGWMGPNYSISTACATSNFCILNAANHIMQGEADVMLAGGSEGAVLPIGIGGFLACRALSRRNHEPEKASRPWDSNRDGFVIGEGAGVLLLEELGHAKQRGAHIYAEFLGGAFTCDAYSLTQPHPEGMRRVSGRGIILCMEKALTVTGVARENVNYINAHGASTQVGDTREFKAMIKCFGQNPQPELRVNSTKSMIGHLLGAAGGVEAVATIQAIRSGWVHPNINLENPDTGMDAKLLVGTKKERLDIKVAMSNSFGFGGHSSSILFAPYKEIK